MPARAKPTARTPATPAAPYRRRARVERRQAWPAVMALETLADFLDCLRGDNKVDDLALKRWRALPGFPAADAATGMWYRDEVEDWLDSRRGRGDPVAASRSSLDARFGKVR